MTPYRKILVLRLAPMISYVFTDTIIVQSSSCGFLKPW